MSLAAVLWASSSPGSKSSGACHLTEPPFEATAEWEVHANISGSDMEEIPKSATQALPDSLTRMLG
jgi:hypothetical protein